MAKDSRYDRVQDDIDRSVVSAQVDRRKRVALVKRLESLDSIRRRVAMYYARRDRALGQEDVIPFVNMLKSIGKVSHLDLIVVSPGGDGTAAETILGLCRRYCIDSLRVVVPSYAKSAATLLALGADRIVMGETSELGPIDAQVGIVQDNAQHWVSADHFLRARDAAMRMIGSPHAGEHEAGQIQLSLLSPAFLQYCEDSMKFAKDFASKQLRSHMFASECEMDSGTWDARVERIVGNLTASSKHLTHGRMITAADIRVDDDLKYLKVDELSSDDSYWLSLNELLLRTEVIVQRNSIGRLLFARGFQLFGA